MDILIIMSQNQEGKDIALTGIMPTDKESKGPKWFWSNLPKNEKILKLNIEIIKSHHHHGHHTNWLGIKRAESIEAIYSGKREQLCSYVIPLTLVIAHSLFIHEHISQNFDT